MIFGGKLEVVPIEIVSRIILNKTLSEEGRDTTYNVFRQSNINPFCVEFPNIQEQCVDSLGYCIGLVFLMYTETKYSIASVPG